MRKTIFLVGDLSSVKTESKDFFKLNIQKAFDNLDGKINLILNSKNKISQIHPLLVRDLKKVEKRGIFKTKSFLNEKKNFEDKLNRHFSYNATLGELTSTRRKFLKKYTSQKKSFEKILNKIFNYSGNLTDNYSLYENDKLIYMNKHRVELFVTPLTQEMLYFDWKCKLLLNSSNFQNDSNLIEEYVFLRMEKIKIENLEILSFLNSLKENNIIILDLLNKEVFDYYDKEKEILLYRDDFTLSSLIKKEIL